jgi:thiamine pyrophosphokinase
VKFVVGDFDELTAAEFETYALWHVADEPAAAE